MKNYALGLMSGTSADGVSAALASFEGHHFKLLAHLTEKYPEKTAQKIRLGSQLSGAQISALNVEIGQIFAKTALHLIRKAHISKEKVACIGSHGQTIYHGPQESPPNTFQIGDPAVMAEVTGLPVVSNFREKDMAVGGQGAPLVPYFDQFFYGQSKVKALLNIGGIANMTVVGKNIPPLAFDTGPGNSLMDRAMRKITHGKEDHDHFGRLAKQGKMDMALISEMMENPFFKKPPPKSTGPEMFGDQFIEKNFGNRLSASPADSLATLNYFTCLSIQESFRSFVFPKYSVSEIIVSGGGVFNKTLLKKLECLFAPIPVVSIEKKGVPPLAKEPVAFAFLGLRCFQNKSNHLPECTGASKACVLGSITRP